MQLDVNSDSDSDAPLDDIPVDDNEEYPSPFNYEDSRLTNTLSKAIKQDYKYKLDLLLLSQLKCEQGVKLMVRELLRQPAIRKDCKNFAGSSPLLLSFQCNCDSSIVDYLLEADCNVNISNNMGTTPLHVAIESRISSVIIHKLIKKGADIDAQDYNNYTPLHCAVENDMLEIVCMLLYYGADVTLSCSHNLTPFMHAVNDIDKLDIARELIKYCTDFSQQTTDGYDALLLAANCKSPITFDIIESGADLNCITHEGNNLFFFALSYTDLLKLVISKIHHMPVIKHPVPFLKLFVQNDEHLSTTEWLECTYLILESSIIVDLILQCKDFPLIRHFLYSFYNRSIDLNHRINIISAFVSFGAEIDADDIEFLYHLFGLNEEYDALIHSVNMDKKCNSHFAAYILGVEMKTSCLYECDFYQKNSFVSSLMELSRNELRKYIRWRCNTKKPYQFYDAVRKLNVPKVIQDIILCKRCFSNPGS